MDPNNELVEILFWIDAFKRASASSITVIVPYFGYAKGDKKDEPRVSIRARVCADCIEVVGADRFITMDLHAPQIQEMCIRDRGRIPLLSVSSVDLTVHRSFSEIIFLNRLRMESFTHLN